ncbi:hypothetical protein [uncultured Bacteroides sp.]|uniref:hypothetical protein n=1 Tax=uncultured Bacteroides sp. TaxID=162156 RepID=UPI002AAB9F99|nr:hypothetical protein [uncultured Bacteroides sp.]
MFLRENVIVLFGMFLGVLAGYFYWLRFGIYWGSYPLSSECWTNCVYGCLVGGFISCFVKGDN